MKRILLLSFCISIYTFASAQTYKWALSESYSQTNSSTDVSVDKNGNLYLLSSFNGAGQSTAPNGNVIAKYTKQGILIWADTISSAMKMVSDSVGNIYLTGTFYKSITFGSNTLSSTDESGYLVKLNSNGEYVWGISISNSPCHNLCLNHAGDVYIIGKSNPTNQSQYGNIGMDKAFIAKYTNGGQLVWAKESPNFTGDTPSTPTNLCFDLNDNLYLTGNKFIAKINLEGNVVWSKDNAGNDLNIIVDSKMNAFVIGNFPETISLSGQTYTNCLNCQSTFIQKYNESGEVLLTKVILGSKLVTSEDITIDLSGNIYIVGIIFGSSDFGNQIVTSGNEATFQGGQAFITKFDSNLKNVWIKNTQGIENVGSGASGNTICIDENNNNIYMAGSLSGPIKFDDITISKGADAYNSIYISQLLYKVETATGIIEGQKNLNFIIYPNPSSGIFTINFKNKTVETEICIHDVLGNCVLNKVSVKNSNQEIDLSSQPKGIYFLEIVSDNERAVKKIVLQ